MSYPNAYCVKCGSHTDTLQKHTVVLQNNARALKGVCPTCETQVYKILPKGKDFGTKVAMTAEEKKKYPDAYCVKCKEHTPTKNAHTVVFENSARACYHIVSPGINIGVGRAIGQHEAIDPIGGRLKGAPGGHGAAGGIEIAERSLVGHVHLERHRDRPSDQGGAKP